MPEPALVERLVKLLGMLGSAHGGERAAAGLKAHELIRRHGLTWSDILQTRPTAAPRPPPPPPRPPPGKPAWRDMLQACEQERYRLNPRECSLLDSLARWRGTPTDKQLAWLTRIYEHIR